MNRFIFKIREFFYGRNGIDRLNIALLIIYFITSAVTSFSFSIVLRLIPYLFFGLAVFRALSKNIDARQRENNIFISFWSPITVKIKKWYQRASDSTHKYYRCPKCKKQLRVPKYRGKIEIKCPQCANSFVRNTGKP